MRKKQAGYSFILVLILLAIGATLVVPALRLTSTSLKSSQIITGRSKSFYAVDAAQEYVMWQLQYTDFADNMTVNEPNNFSVDVCGTPVAVTVVMRAIATWRGVTLIADTPIKPEKTVSPDTDPGGAILTYTIRLEQISSNTSQGLDAVYDILPADFATSDYISGSSRLRVDGGPWQDVIGGPLIEQNPGSGFRVRLRWPNPLTYGSENFTSPIRDFTGGQVKEIKFQMASSRLKNNMKYYNWVVLKPWNTLSGPTANITTGTGANPQGGLIDVTTTAVPAFIPPGQMTDIRYDLYIKNQQDSTDFIEVITDYLPPGFYYIGPTSGLTTIAPVETFGSVNGVERWTLTWTRAQFPGGNDVSISSGATEQLTFWARTSENVSGSYYNELTVQTRNGVPNAFAAIGITQQDFNTGYSWNSAPVIVPAYDSSATSGGVTVTTNANLAVTAGGMSIYSYQVK